MTTQELFNNFSRGINWNATSYIAYKILVTLFTFTLYRYATAETFSYWANINSTLFLLLLWSDFGLRKSIPRFLPELAHNQRHLFIRHAIWFQALILIGLLPLFAYYLWIFPRIHNTYILAISSGLFITEGCVSLMRLLCHTYFLHRPFNILATSIMILEIGITLSMLIILEEQKLLSVMLGVKLCASIILLVLASILFARRHKSYSGTHTTSWDSMRGKFIKHSGIMWVNTNLKSLSERNFLVPFFTYAIGPVYANIFKVANDAALLFYRILIKTVGSADTVLLAHVQAREDRGILMPIAFTKLTTKVAAICLPLLGVIFVIFLQGDYLFNDPFIFRLFLIMSCGYIAEVLLLPYERILEINHNYWLLFLAYIPYGIMLVLLFTQQLNMILGLLGAIICIHIVRLVSLCMMVAFAHYHYHLKFPFRYFLKHAFIYVCIALCTHSSLEYVKPWYAQRAPYIVAYLHNRIKPYYHS